MKEIKDILRVSTKAAAVLLLFILVGGAVSAQECNIVYAKANGANSGNAGTKSNPASLQYALSLASPTDNQIWLAVGTYNISAQIDMVSDVTLEGGFDPNTWEKTNSATTNIVRDNTNPLPAPERLVAISCVGLTNFNLVDLKVDVMDAGGSGVTTYGVYLDNCSNYNLVRLKVHAGNGSDGIDGVAGADGIDGADGADGQDGNECGGGNIGGGAGGNTGAGFPGGDGGDGGPEGDPVVLWPPWDADLGRGFDGNPGTDGQGPLFGIGGIAGERNRNLTPSSDCFFIGACSAGLINNGGNATAGGNGNNGADGANGVPTHTGGFFVPGDGQDGVDGEHGSGGGGGGGGGSHGGALLGENGSGAGGGGGGEGGQGGFGATGGSGGGGSFGIYLWNNGPNGTISDCNATSGIPGLGGIGGIPGGQGGDGGRGGLGGGTGCSNGRGGDGGNAGDGGRGGNGGSGSPGFSQGIFEDPAGIVAAQINMNSPVEPQVFLKNTGCTFSDIEFSTNATGIIQWYFDGGAIPLSQIGNTVEIQYNNIGRHSITLVINGIPYVLTDFEGIFTDGTPYLPTIQSTNDTVCPGGIASFSASFPNNFVPLNYEWNFGDTASSSNTSTNPAPTHTYNDVGTYLVTCQTESPCCGWSKIDTFVVHVVPFLEPEVFISSTSNNVCEGEAVTFGAVGINGGDNPQYEWLVNGSPVATGSTYTTSTLTTGTSVACRMTSNYPCATNNPKTSAPIVMSVHPNPVVSCSSVNNYLGGNTTFDAPVAPGTGTAPFSYVWNFGDGGAAYSANPIHTYGGTGTYNVSVTVSDTFGCSGVCNMPVTIIIPPYVYADFSSVITQDCGSSTVNFTDITVGNPTTWYWDFGDGGTSNVQNPTYTFQNPGVFNVTLAAGNGVFTDTITYPNHVVVIPNPVANFTSNKQVVCSPGAIKFYDESSTSVAWSWDFGDGITSNLQNPGHIYETPGQYNVELTVTTHDGCTNTVLKEGYITVLVSPEAGFTADTMVCTTVPLFFVDSSINANSWSWNFGVVDSFTDNNQFPSYIYEEPGEYTITQAVSNSLGCPDTLIKELYIEAIPYPDAYFEPDSFAVQLPDTILQLFNYSQYFTDVQWDFSNGDSSKLLNPEVYYQEPGVYTIILYASNELGCVDTFELDVEVFEQETFFVPNSFTPDGDGLNETWQVHGKGIVKLSMRIFDRWGKMIYRTNSLDEPWKGIDEKGEPVPQGVYTFYIQLEWYTGKTFERRGTISVIR